MEDRSYSTKDNNQITFKFFPEALIICTCENSKKEFFCEHISAAFTKPLSIFKNREDAKSMESIIHEYEHNQNIAMDIYQYLSISDEIKLLQKKQRKFKKIVEKGIQLTNNGLLLLEDYKK